MQQQRRRSGKKERQDETQFITKIDDFLSLNPCMTKLSVLVLCFHYFMDNSINTSISDKPNTNCFSVQIGTVLMFRGRSVTLINNKGIALMFWNRCWQNLLSPNNDFDDNLFKTVIIKVIIAQTHLIVVKLTIINAT